MTARLRWSDLSTREQLVAELCVEPLTMQEMATRLRRLDGKAGTVGLRTVRQAIERLADRIGGDGRPRMRVAKWVNNQRRSNG